MRKAPPRRGKTTIPPASSRQSPAERRHQLALDPIITMDAVGVIQSASDSVEHVFGWTPNELLGRNVRVLIPEPRRSSLDRYLDRYRRADPGRSLTRSRRFDAVRKDGSAVPIELSMSRADLPAQEEPFFIGIVRDCSTEIDVGGDSPATRSRLQKLVTEQTRALATAHLRLHLTDRLTSLGTLAAGLGHDMNNVLLPVRARLNAIEHSGIPASALNHVNAVRRSVAYLQHLSDGLRFLTMDPSGPSSNSDEACETDLAQWWKQVGVLLRKAVPSGIRIKASFPAHLPAVQSAPHWLTQAVLNLFVNANEASLRPHSGHIQISATPSANRKTVRLSVADRGRGMSADVRKRAFDLFFTTKSRGMGTGLGLPLVRKVAERAGGHVELQSEPNRGTVVTLVLPAVASKPRSPKTPAVTATISLRDTRTSALVAQILIAAGVHITRSTRSAPGPADIWITQPSLATLASAQRRHKLKPPRILILLGDPPASQKAKWAALNPVVVPTPADFETLRLALGHASTTVEGRRTH
jgi:PAS domain S-box-containing protein